MLSLAPTSQQIRKIDVNFLPVRQNLQLVEPSHHVLIIEYKHRFDAERAKAELDGREVEGFALHIYWFDSFPGRSRLVDRSANASVVSVHFKYSYKVKGSRHVSSFWNFMIVLVLRILESVISVDKDVPGTFIL